MRRKANKRIKAFYVPNSYNIYANNIVLSKYHMITIIVVNKTATFKIPDIDIINSNSNFSYYPNVELLYHENNKSYTYYVYDIKVRFSNENNSLDNDTINTICTNIFGIASTQIMSNTEEN